MKWFWAGLFIPGKCRLQGFIVKRARGGKLDSVAHDAERTSYRPGEFVLTAFSSCSAKATSASDLSWKLIHFEWGNTW